MWRELKRKNSFTLSNFREMHFYTLKSSLDALVFRKSRMLAPFVFKIKMWQVFRTSCWSFFVLLRVFFFSSGILSCRRDRVRHISIQSRLSFCFFYTLCDNWFSNFCWALYFALLWPSFIFVGVVNDMFSPNQNTEIVIDHRSYTHNLRSCETKAWKKNSGLNEIRSHDLCDTGTVSTNWAIKPSGSWSHCEFGSYLE